MPQYEPPRDHYQVLGVSRDATSDELKAAFRKLASQHHPDRNPDDPTASLRFREIATSYNVLRDPGRRAMYDRVGHVAEQSGSPFGEGGPFAGGVIDLSQLEIDGILGDLLGVFGIGKRDRGDIQRELRITLEEAAFGCEKQVTYERTAPCGPCNGTGAADGASRATCPQCEGRGRIAMARGLGPLTAERGCTRCRGMGTISVKSCASCAGNGVAVSPHTIRATLPRGVEDGASHVVPAAGNTSRVDRPAGDLLLTIRVESHPVFQRIGDDVSCRVPISFTQATLGGVVDVTTLEGVEKLRIPSGTQPGAVLRIRGKGVPHRHAGGRGDQRVEIAVEIPTSLSPSQRDAVEQLAREMGEVVVPQRRTFIDKVRALFE